MKTYEYFVSFSTVINNQVRFGNGRVVYGRKILTVPDILETERFLEMTNNLDDKSLTIMNFILLNEE